MAIVGPVELIFLRSECIEGTRYFGEILDESTIEVEESKETSEFFASGGYGPLSDTFGLGGVHFDGLMANDQSKVFGFGLLEFTLGMLKV